MSLFSLEHSTTAYRLDFALYALAPVSHWHHRRHLHLRAPIVSPTALRHWMAKCSALRIEWPADAWLPPFQFERRSMDIKPAGE